MEQNKNDRSLLPIKFTEDDCLVKRLIPITVGRQSVGSCRYPFAFLNNLFCYVIIYESKGGAKTFAFG